MASTLRPTFSDCPTIETQVPGEASGGYGRIVDIFDCDAGLGGLNMSRPQALYVGPYAKGRLHE